MLISQQIAAAFAVACMFFALVIFVPWDKTEKWLGRGNRIKPISVFKYSTATIVCLVVIIVAWNSIVSIFPTSTVIYDVSKEGSYVLSTKNPAYRENQRTYRYSLLVEFGSKNALVDIVLNTDEEYKLYEIGIGKPNQKAIMLTDEKTIPQRQGIITIGSTDVVVDRKPKYLACSSSNELITATASFYVYLEGDSPLEVTSAIFDGKHFELVEDRLIPSK